MYRADSPTAEAPLGAEFVNSVTAFRPPSNMGLPESVRVLSGLLTCLSADDGAILDAHITLSPGFRGIRHASGWDAGKAVRNSHTNRYLLRDDNFRQGIAELEKRSLSFDAWLYPQIAELIELAKTSHPLRLLPVFLRSLGVGPMPGSGR